MTTPSARNLTAAILATLFAAGASAALAQKDEGEPTYSSAERSEICQEIGCNNGRLECGTVHSQRLRTIPIGFGEWFGWIESESWSCFENAPPK
jgi:hypothetical protein